MSKNRLMAIAGTGLTAVSQVSPQYCGSAG
jgi:hypothetical protein